MKRLILLCGISLCIMSASSDFYAGNLPDGKNFPSLLSDGSESPVLNHIVDSVYENAQLALSGLDQTVFARAYKGYQYLLSKGMLKNSGVLTICDYSQSSHNKRLYVIDMINDVLLFNTYVSHGKKSGGEFATSFSNLTNSNKSSLGFLVTSDTYSGHNGYSMRFNGVEPGINDNVNSRSIVMHGSNYVNAARADEGTMMGRSFGCPAVSYGEHKAIINTIKGGSCFYINSSDNWYRMNSQILNARFSWPVLLAASTAATTQPAQASAASSSM